MRTKNHIESQNIKTKEDIRRFFRKMINDKEAWTECVQAGRSTSELEKRGMKMAKLSDVLS